MTETVSRSDYLEITKTTKTLLSAILILILMSHFVLLYHLFWIHSEVIHIRNHQIKEEKNLQEAQSFVNELLGGSTSQEK